MRKRFWVSMIICLFGNFFHTVFCCWSGDRQVGGAPECWSLYIQKTIADSSQRKGFCITFGKAWNMGNIRCIRAQL